ncbi:hypothetical protein PENTCL1PPCAC_24983, partial [Pristionchus entomophagus]
NRGHEHDVVERHRVQIAAHYERLIIHSLAEEIRCVDGFSVVSHRYCLPGSSIHHLFSAEKLGRNGIVELAFGLDKVQDFLALLNDILSLVHEALHLPQVETGGFINLGEVRIVALLYQVVVRHCVYLKRDQRS